MSKRPKYLSQSEANNVAAFSEIRDDIYLLEAFEKGELEDYLADRLLMERSRMETADEEIAELIRKKIADLELLEKAASDDPESLESIFLSRVRNRLTHSLERLMTHEGARKKLELNDFELQNLERMGKMTREARFKLRLFVEGWLRETIGS